MPLKKYVEIFSLLAGELVTKPGWAYHHLWGFVDERLLLRFHPARTDGNMDCGSVEEVLSRIPPHRSQLTRSSEPRPSIEYSPTAGSVIAPSNDASQELQRLVHGVMLQLRPEVVVEVGVGRGATTKTILSAMAENGFGRLYSIEFPSLRRNYRKSVGSLVPAELRSRWKLIWGPSQTELPRLFRELRRVDVFVHDGAHSYYLQRHDFRTAAGALQAGSVLISDDITNASFNEVIGNSDFVAFLVRQSKGNPIGVAYRAPTSRERHE